MTENERLGDLERRMVIIERRLFGDGNGDPGLCKMVRSVYDWVEHQKGSEERAAEDQAAAVVLTGKSALKATKRANFIQLGLLIVGILTVIILALSIYLTVKESHKSKLESPEAQMQDSKIPALSDSAK